MCISWAVGTVLLLEVCLSEGQPRDRPELGKWWCFKPGCSPRSCPHGHAFAVVRPVT